MRVRLEEARWRRNRNERTSERHRLTRRQRLRQQRFTGKGFGKTRRPKTAGRREKNKKGNRVVGRKVGADGESGACISR